MSPKTAAAALILTMAATPSVSQNSILGFGIMSCAEVISAAQRQPFRDQLVAWAGGFLSGGNVARIERDREFADVSGMKNVDIIIGHIIARCSANPNQQLAEATAQISRSLPTRPFIPAR